MGLFKKDPFKALLRDYDREDCADILETARGISQNDPEVVKAMGSALDNPKDYFKQNAERFAERGIDFGDESFADELDIDELLFLAMVDELEEHGFAFEFDYKCELADFLWGLEQLKTYELIKDVLPNVKLDESEDIEKWGAAINAALGEKAVVSYIDIDSDSYPVAIMTWDALQSVPIPFVMAM